MIFGGYFDLDSKLNEIKSLEEVTASLEFWNDSSKAQDTISKLNYLKEVTGKVIDLKERLSNNLDVVSLLETELDNDLFSSLEIEIHDIDTIISSLELEVLLSGEYDSKNAIVEIHSGAGGTEACDWANMLYRMYERYCQNKGYKIEILDTLEGEEAGIKKVVMLVSGLNAYGYLKCEKGVHRLVRLSPFDANNKRHTSFASVDVVPEFDNDINIEIKEEDLKIDVYRSSGAGGQSVNTTDSAVRITHLPSKIVVTCQNERSQLKNKEKALSILKGKLLLIEEEKKEKELALVKGENKKIDFGSQIRSYVMHPYSMVKDHRTGIETSNVQKVLDGDLDMFIEGYLRS